MSVEYDLKTLMGMLNPVCRQSLEEAAAVCVSFGHFQIEPEHYLFRLLQRANTDIEKVLTHCGIIRAELKAELEESLSHFPGGNSRIPTFSPQIRELLREAWLVASLHLKSTRIRSGAILMALRVNPAMSQRILQSLPSLNELPTETLWEDLENLIRNSSEAKSSQAPMGSSPPAIELAPTAVMETPALDKFTVDLTEKVRKGELDPIIGRDDEVRQMIDILTRRRQNNPILVGEAGVGKTAVVEGFAQRVVKGNVPPALLNVSVRMLDLPLLQAGASVAGEFESRLKAVVNEIQSAGRPIILFIDEAHMLIGAGGAAGQADAANILKPALARGEVRTIAATTWDEYKRYVERDPALSRRFQLVKVEEPTPEVAVAMLRGLVERLESHHHVRVLEEAVMDAVRLSKRYLTGRHLPDSAVSVLDTATARVAVAQKSRPAEVEDAIRRVERIKEELAALEAESKGRYGEQPERVKELLAALEVARAFHNAIDARWKTEREQVEAILDLEVRLANDQSEETKATLETARAALLVLQGQTPLIPLAVDGRVVASVISGWTGVPVGKMVTDEVTALLGLEERLKARVVGQDEALAAIARRIRTSRASLSEPDKPVGVFLLAGPSGVGKTETAAAVADELFGGERHMVVVNMSEYQEAHSVSQLRGAPPG